MLVADRRPVHTVVVDVLAKLRSQPAVLDRFAHLMAPCPGFGVHDEARSIAESSGAVGRRLVD